MSDYESFPTVHKNRHSFGQNQYKIVKNQKISTYTEQVDRKSPSIPDSLHMLEDETVFLQEQSQESFDEPIVTSIRNAD